MDHIWLNIYNSILCATQRNFELIIVHPHNDIPNEILQYKNIKFFKDCGPPMRCAQIAATLAEGKVLNILPADDGVYLPNTIDQGIDALYKMGDNYKNVVSVQYYEGLVGHKIKQPREYYQLNYHDATKLSCIPNGWIGFNNGFIYRKYFEELGGWDCRYETAPMGLADLAIRIQRDKGNIVLEDIMLLDYDWFPGDTGDHKPIFDAQIQRDQPFYQQIYKNGYDNLPIKINIDNWKNSPKIWTRKLI